MWSNENQDYNKFSYICRHKNMDLKTVLLEEMDVSIRMICNLKREGGIFLNGKEIKLHQKTTKGDIITLILQEDTNEYLSQDSPLNIIYEDIDLLVVNKDAGVVVHPTKSHQENTLLNYVKFYFESKDIKSKVRFVNRLDRDTTGLVVIAKNQYAHSILTKENSMWDMDKKYIALVSGTLKEKSGTINQPIGKVCDGDIRRHVFEGGQKAITHYKVVREFTDSILGEFSMIEVKLETGRTHQIRAHFEHLGHPLFGDELYNGNMDTIKRQALHCCRLSFKTPRNGEITLKAPLPDDIKALTQNK